MSLWEKLADVGELVKTGYQRHFGDEDPDAPSAGEAEAEGPAPVVDAQTAWQVLELDEGSTLDEVRAAYRRLARSYHPQAQGAGEEAEAAQNLLGTFLEALEFLEEHLLPLSDRVARR